MTKLVSFINWRGRFSAANNLGQLVTDDIYNCYAIYCVQQLNANFEYGQRPKLVLIEKDNPLNGPLKCTEYKIPNTVVTKLKNLLAMKNDLEKKDQDSSPNGVVQKQFMEMKRIILSSQESVENTLQNVESKVDNFNNGMEQSVEICGMKKQIEIITNNVELIKQSQ